MELPQQVTCRTGLQVQRIADILQDAFWRPANDGKPPSALWLLWFLIVWSWSKLVYLVKPAALRRLYSSIRICAGVGPAGCLGAANC